MTGIVAINLMCIVDVIGVFAQPLQRRFISANMMKKIFSNNNTQLAIQSRAHCSNETAEGLRRSILSHA